MTRSWPRDLYYDSVDSDLELHIEAVHSDKVLVFPGHSLVLKRTSGVFKTMLEEGKFKESRTGKVELKVPGNELDVTSFYRYIYKKDLPDLELGGYLALIQTGREYKIYSLQNICTVRIWSKLTPYNVCGIEGVVKNFKRQFGFEKYNIFRRWLSVMLRSAFLIFHNNSHLSFGQDTMEQLLKSDVLNVLDEDQVVEAVWNWGRARISTEKIDPAQTISQLLDLVRWNEVINTDEEAPWFEVARCRKLASIEQCKIRKSDFTISLTDFSHVCNIHANTIKYGEKSYPDEGKFDLAAFTVNKNIFISGFDFQVTTSQWMFDIEEPDFQVTLNKKDIMDERSWKVKFRSDRNSKFRFFLVHLQFRTPVSIGISRINIISIIHSKNPATLKSTPNFRLRNSCLESPRKVNFDFHGDVKGVSRIYYFVKE